MLRNTTVFNIDIHKFEQIYLHRHRFDVKLFEYCLQLKVGAFFIQISQRRRPATGSMRVRPMADRCGLLGRKPRFRLVGYQPVHPVPWDSLQSPQVHRQTDGIRFPSSLGFWIQQPMVPRADGRPKWR